MKCTINYIDTDLHILTSGDLSSISNTLIGLGLLGYNFKATQVRNGVMGDEVGYEVSAADSKNEYCDIVYHPNGGLWINPAYKETAYFKELIKEPEPLA